MSFPQLQGFWRKVCTPNLIYIYICKKMAYRQKMDHGNIVAEQDVIWHRFYKPKVFTYKFNGIQHA